MNLFSREYRMLKKMGYLKDQKGILRRYLDEKTNWESHIVKTKQFIVNHATGKNNGSVAVLGSGWLLDVPVDFLSSYFKNVYLFDIYHPRPVREQIKKYNNIIFVKHDISGGAISEAYRAAKIFRKNGTILHPCDFNIDGFAFPVMFDCVISLNILNQLDILSLDYLIPLKIYSKEEITILRTTIQQKHLDSLPAGKSILISDYEEIWYDAEGRCCGNKPLIFANIPKEKIRARWEWVFDTHFNYYSDRNVSFNVMALSL